MYKQKGFNVIVVLVLLGVGIVIGVVAITVVKKETQPPIVIDDITEEFAGSDEMPIIDNIDDNLPKTINDETVTIPEVIEEPFEEEESFIKNIFSSNKNKLDLSNQGLTQVSQDVFKKTNLVELDVSNNKLTGALPGEIRHLQKLEVLNASNNQMTGVPAEVGQLGNLRILDLSNNQLTGLPYELANLKNLEILNLSGNDYSKYDMDIIRPGLPSDAKIID